MNLNDLSFEEVKALADSVEGYEFDGRWSEDKIRKTLTEYQSNVITNARILITQAEKSTPKIINFERT